MEAARCRLQDGPDEFILRASDFTEEELSQTVWLNKVGTFGVGSAGYWWGRAGAALMRLSHYCQGDVRMLWLLLYSDDSWATASGPRADRDLLLHLLVLGVIGTPLAWHKLHGGAVLEWIGYALDVGRFEMGVTEKRIQWAVRWIDDKVREGSVRLGDSERDSVDCNSLQVPLIISAPSWDRCTRGFLPALVMRGHLCQS